MDFNARIVALREKSAKAFADAKAIRDEFASADGDVPADKLEQFNRAIEDSTKTLEEAQKLEAQASELSRLEEAHSRPVNALPSAGRETQRERAAESRKEAHRKAFVAWAQGDTDSAKETLAQAGYGRSEAHALISGDGAKGGFLVPEDFRAEVIRREAEIAVIRSIARVIPTSRDELVMPRVAANTGSYPKAYGSGFTGDWDTEQGSTTETSGSVTVKTQQNQPTFEQVRIPVNNWIPNPVVASMSLLDDAAVPLEEILADEIAMTKAADEDAAFINGSGIGEPAGFAVNSTLQTGAITAGASSAITYGGLLDLLYGLASPYAQNGVILMRRSTMANILALETGSGVDLVFKNAQAGPNNLMGYRVLFSEFMPAEGSNTYPLAFGDFRRGYVIADRMDLRVQRLNERYAPNVGFAPVCRVGGAVVLPEAIKLGKTPS